MIFGLCEGQWGLAHREGLLVAVCSRHVHTNERLDQRHKGADEVRLRSRRAGGVHDM